MTIRIIDYGSGNLHSVQKAFQKMGDPLSLKAELTSNPDALASASHIVLPGVGAFGDCVAGLLAVDGMKCALEEAVLQRGIPFFGICVGMQMMLERGFEHGEHDGLGWIRGDVVSLQSPVSSLQKNSDSWPLATGDTRQEAASSPELVSSRSAGARSGGQPLRIPHMGWNELNLTRAHPILSALAPQSHVYFVHSYHALCANADDILATTNYGGPVVAAIGRDNLLGAQFHPEKSGAAGLRLIRQFLSQ